MSNGKTALRAAFQFLQQVPPDKRTPEYVREHIDELWATIDEVIFPSLVDADDTVSIDFDDPHGSARLQFTQGDVRVALFNELTEKWEAR